ncbi:hypothetical protein DFP91_4351 [Pseudorhodoplanes sinuspersici]|nr:hypothetical protein DFP91_4351 [Pseudorhodoplanes sinuspersici]
MTEDSVANIAVCFEHRSVDASVTTTPGGIETPARHFVGPAPSLHSQQVEIEYKKPTAFGMGGGSKSATSTAYGPAPLSLRDFFSAAENFGTLFGRFKQCRPRVSRKSRVISMGACSERQSYRADGCIISRFIFIRPGGGRKSGWFRSDTGGLATQTFARVSRTFFLIRSVA